MKTLLYATLAYPGDLYSEKMFVDSELPALRQHFDRIILLPTDLTTRDSDYASTLPEGVTVDWSLCEDRVYSSRLLKAVYVLHPFVLRTLWEIRGEARGIRRWLKGMFSAINIVRAGNIIRRAARRHGLAPADTVMYSMWFADVASAMARLGLNEGWHVATRAHTSDLYDDRPLFRSRRLRARLLGGLDGVLAISRRGTAYMRERYPEAADKIHFHPLGSVCHVCPCAEPTGTTSRRISLVTTARLHPVKCLDVLMDTLDRTAALLPDRQIRWTLIGDGEGMEDLLGQSRRLKSANLEVVLAGAMDNKEIQRLYDVERPDWFILMSRSEGVPVSMGEAMSHSIPVITTDVGEIRELADESCAVLLPGPYSKAGTSRTSPEQYAELIAPVVADTTHREKMAEAARKRWEETFDARILSGRTARFCAALLSEAHGAKKGSV